MNSVVRKKAVAFLIKVKSAHQHNDDEKYFLPNPNPMIDSLGSLPSKAATRFPQQESFLSRALKQQPGKESCSSGALLEYFCWDSPQVTNLFTGQGNYCFCAQDLVKEEVNYSLCQAIHNSHKIGLNFYI